MDNQAPSMLKATLIGGSVFGVVGGLPIIGALNCACCILIVGGGFLAAFLYSKDCAVVGFPFRAGNGAIVGLVAGLFYTISTSIVGGIFRMIMPQDPEQVMEALDQFDMPPESREMAEQWVESMSGGGGVLITVLFTLVLAAIFSTIGGLIGGAVFKQEPPAAAPPAPPAAPPMDGGSPQ